LVWHKALVARNPASAIKLVTTFVALDVLGPGYVWGTDAYVDAPIEKGRLTGDLYLKGGGDPFLVTERFWSFLRGLRDAGLRDIDGELVLDESFFDVGPVDPAAFDAKPHRSYNVAPNALLLNFNATRFLFFPEPGGDRVRIVADPPSATLQIDNALEPSPGACQAAKYHIRMHVEEVSSGGRVRFSGPYPQGCGRHELTRVVSAPTPYVFGVFKSLWSEMGGSISGGVRLGKVPAGARRFFRTTSRPLAEQIRGINKFSNNVMTRQLFLTLGAHHDGVPGTEDKGRRAVSEWLRNAGFDTRQLYIDNGAGLSRDTRVDAQTLGEFLLAAYESPYMPEFISSLPLAAIDGSMKRRFNGEALQGRLHIKTGLLDHVRTMGGYVSSKSGKTFVVVALHSHPGVHKTAGTLVQDSLLRWVYEQ
jgi:D-alanyl-D-alanine carboxypeptidase/D-alanyl-D-alanine-endopeptidase (penicillin-binding protein 4)